MQMTITEWQLYFELEYGLENRERIMKEFCAFVKNPDSVLLPIHGHVRVGGKVHNSASFADGTLINTSEVRSFRKGTLITDDEGNMYATITMTTSDKNMSALTMKGHVYILDYLGRSSWQRRMEMDAIIGALSPEPMHYINPDLRIKKGLFL